MAAWFNANSSSVANLFQLYKLGSDESVTQWTANPGDAGQANQGLDPFDLTAFNGAVWFNGETTSQHEQLFKLGADGSVTQWTAVGPSLFEFQSGDLTVFNNALWFDGRAAAGTQDQPYQV